MKLYFKHENGFLHDGRIYCEVCCVPDIENNEELLNEGWLPSMEENKVWYQSRSCRLNLNSGNISAKRRNVLNKIKIEFFDYNNNREVNLFFYEYYKKKNFDIFDLYKNCSDFFKTKIVKMTFKNLIVGYGRFTEEKNSILFLNLAYTDLFPKLSLGTNLFFILSEYAKTQNKKYLYIYESYDNIFNYKQNFENVEIWNGREWLINYGKS